MEKVRIGRMPAATSATSLLKELAPSNIKLTYVTLDTFQLLSGWLKELAPLNILFISVTL